MDKGKNCSICGREAVFYATYLKQELCKKHFERMLMKRIRSNLNSYGIKDRYFKFENKNSCGMSFLRFFFKDRESSNGLRLYSYTLEDFALAVMRFFLFHEESRIKIRGKYGFSPLYNVSENEIAEFFKSKEKEISPITREGKDRAVLDFLKDIEERRPGGMMSLVKAGITLNII